MKTVQILLLGVSIAAYGMTSNAQAASHRASWVVNEIYDYNHTFAAQLPSELATKMSKMAASPFAFYRGSADIFYQDMRTLPASMYLNQATSDTWLEGDMHLLNMGALRDSSGNNIFDTSDFDEGYLGPYVWDVRRMAVSVLLTAKENGISSSDAQQVVSTLIDSYISAMDSFKGNDGETSFRLTSSNTSGVIKDTIQAASNQTRDELLSKYTYVSGNQRKFQTQDNLQPVSSSIYNSIRTGMSAYIASISSSKRYPKTFYSLKDIRQKYGSGIGSLGRYRYLLLIEGPSTSLGDDVILEMKQETASTVSIAAPGNFSPMLYGNSEGQRVATSMKAMLSNTDTLDGYLTMNGLTFMIHEKSPYQRDFDYTQLSSYSKFNEAAEYLGEVMANNHALADKDYNANIVPYSIDKEITDLLAPVKSSFKSETLNFALDYQMQVEYDYADFLAAYQAGVPLY